MPSRFTLLELNNLIGHVIQDNFSDTVWVIAEISEMKVNRTGHCYLELVEKNTLTDEIAARARATIWSYTFRMLKPYFETSTGQSFSDGIVILVQVSVEFHPAYGFSYNIKDIDPTYTLGDMVRRRREIIARLQEAGIFDMNRELPLPLVPQRIAVISSATAAGYQDFIHQLDNNGFKFVFSHPLFEAYMQGSEAVPSILKALDNIFQQEENFDAVAIIRGGGAQADLSCFDNFDLAYAVAQFPLPVITGIGHEKDDTILDLVAHTRQKTPTAAAEFFISGLARFRERLEELQELITGHTTAILDRFSDELEELGTKTKNITGQFLASEQLRLIKAGKRYKSGVSRFVDFHSHILDKLRLKISRLPVLLLNKKQFECGRLTHDIRFVVKNSLQTCQLKLAQTAVSFPVKVRTRLQQAGKELKSNEESLRMLDPQNILKRGFTISLQNGKTVKSVQTLSEQVNLETRFHDGSVISKIVKE
jgi:exodeoxyribonuclease VII large subunit